MAIEVQNEKIWPLFLAEAGKVLNFGEIAEVAEKDADRLRQIGLFRVGEEVLHDIEQLRDETGIRPRSSAGRQKRVAAGMSLDADHQAAGQSVAESAIHDDPSKAVNDPNVPSIDDLPSVEPSVEPEPTVEPVS